MKKHNHLLKWLLILCAIGVVGWMNRRELPKITQALEKIPWGVLLSAGIVSCLYFLFEGRILTLLSRKYRAEFSLRDGITGAYFTQFYRLLTLGNGTALSEIYYLHRKNISAAHSTGMCLVQYLIQRLSIALLGVLSGFFVFFLDPSVITAHRHQIVLSYGISLLVVCILLFAGTCRQTTNHVFCFLELRVKRQGSLHARLCTLQQQVNTFQESCRNLLGERTGLWQLLGCNMLKISCNMAVPAILLSGFGLQKDFGSYLALMGMVFVLAGVIPAPGGIGSLEWVFLLLFSNLVPKETAAAVVIIYRLFTALLPFLAGALVSACFGAPRQPA